MCETFGEGAHERACCHHADCLASLAFTTRSCTHIVTHAQTCVQSSVNSATKHIHRKIYMSSVCMYTLIAICPRRNLKHWFTILATRAHACGHGSAVEGNESQGGNKSMIVDCDSGVIAERLQRYTDMPDKGCVSILIGTCVCTYVW